MMSQVASGRNRIPLLAAGGLLLIVLGALFWWLASPLWINQRVSESASSMGGMVVAQGSLMDADSVHKGSGKVYLEKRDGQTHLRFENINVTNGPDLVVYLSGVAMPTNSEQVHQNGVELGKLKGNQGSFSYTLDSTVDISKAKSVVIYCRAFRVVFSTATLKQ